MVGVVSDVGNDCQSRDSVISMQWCHMTEEYKQHSYSAGIIVVIPETGNGREQIHYYSANEFLVFIFLQRHEAQRRLIIRVTRSALPGKIQQEVCDQAGTFACFYYGHHQCRAPTPFLAAPGSPATPWPMWVHIFRNYLMAIDGDSFSDNRRTAILLHYIGNEGQRVYYSLPTAVKQKVLCKRAGLAIQINSA